MAQNQGKNLIFLDFPNVSSKIMKIFKFHLILNTIN